MTHALDATGQYNLGTPQDNFHGGAIEGLQTRGTIALHGPRRYMFTTAQAQGNHPGNIDFIRAGHHTADNDFINIRRFKGLPGQQGQGTTDTKVGRETWYEIAEPMLRLALSARRQAADLILQSREQLAI